MALHPSIRIEGGLLGPDLVDQLRAGELPGQKPADFAARPSASPAAKTRSRGGRVREARPVWGDTPRPKRSLTDEVARAFADARSLWSIFQRRHERLPAEDAGTSMTRASWVEPFLGLLDYELVYNRRAYDLGGLTFAISHRAGSPEDAPPVHIVGIGQELGRAPASGRPRLAPHALLQEYLNRTEALWGVVTNGATLRLLRDSTYIRRQAYVEFDISGMLDEQRFEDFDALYRLLHRSRLPAVAGDAGDCLIERYFAHGVEQGGRVRERLRDGVEQCIEMLANGFLRHPANHDLRERAEADAESGARVTERDLYRHLLVLVYRLLFLLVAEDRGLLGANPLYRGHYGIGRLRSLLDRPASDIDHDDLWQSLRVVWRVLAADSPEEALGGRPLAALLGLPVLNGDLFTPGLFDDATIANRDLIAAFDHLARYQEGTGPRRRVNYAALDVEELGSVYESLLDRQPVLQPDAAGKPAFQLAAGSERKSTGSFYTPPDVVTELVQSALSPVLEERLKACATRTERERAVLSLRVCDPACGSGHFLLAAARRLGKALARIRTDEEEPAPERVREAIRDVVAHSIYGVDRNPLAVDLCRVALWIESHDPEKPLTFLDHRIRCGDSLIGVFDLDVLAAGVPDAAFAPLKEDDTRVARLMKTRNRDERERGQDRLPWDSTASVTGFADVALRIEAIADDSPEQIRRKRALFEHRHDDTVRMRQYFACHLWTAAFFRPLLAGESAITTATLAEHLSGRDAEPSALDAAVHIADEHRFFHWPLEFPEVFDGRRSASAGFDVVLGNPPYLSFSGRQAVALDNNVRKYFSSNYPVAGWQTSHGFFVVRAHSLSKRRVGLIVPDQVGHLEGYEAIRSAVTTSSSLVAVRYYGENVFEAVTPALTLVTDKAHRGGVKVETVDGRSVECTVAPGSRWTAPSSHTTLIDKLRARAAGLDQCFADPGVHTGNCAKKLILSMNEAPEDSVPVLEGKQVKRYDCVVPKKVLRTGYVASSGEYFTIRPIERYQNAKFVIRQTASHPIVGPRRHCKYFRNSLLALYEPNDGRDVRFVVAILNSRLTARGKSRGSGLAAAGSSFVD